MSNGHTPGPWIVDAPGMVATKATGADGWEICDIRDDVPECDANADLIAAAPELLEALEALTANYADVEPGGSKNVDKARAALAKARGAPC